MMDEDGHRYERAFVQHRPDAFPAIRRRPVCQAASRRAVGGDGLAALVALTVGPFVFFNGQLGKAKQRAVLVCGALAGRQLRAFEEKWLGATPPAVGEMLRAPDFSAVSDFNPTVTAIQKMNTLPFWPEQLVLLFVAALLPSKCSLLVALSIRRDLRKGSRSGGPSRMLLNTGGREV
jgi:hypothetical protein